MANIVSVWRHYTTLKTSINHTSLNKSDLIV